LIIPFFVSLESKDLNFGNKPDQLKEVHIGAYIINITEINLIDQKFNAEFYIWFRWKGKDYNPIDHYTIVNGVIKEKVDKYIEEKENEEFYGYEKIQAQIYENFKMDDFPFDAHILEIKIEDSNEIELIKFIPDIKNSQISSDIDFGGWGLDYFNTAEYINIYKTNYGDLSLPSFSESTYSQFNFSIYLKRVGVGYFFKLMVGVIISTLICILSFKIKPIHLDPRFGLSIGSLFGAVASEYVVISSIPPTSVMTVADKIHILSFIIILSSIAISTYSLKLFDENKIEKANLLDKIAFRISSIVYLVLIGFIIYLANFN